MSDFNWGNLLVAGLQTGGQLLQGHLQNKADDEKQKKDQLFKLELEKLKNTYLGSGGGGGGGGGGPDKTSMLLDAYNNYIKNNIAARDRQSSAYQDMITATTRPLLR